jgi:hypothetical protein
MLVLGPALPCRHEEADYGRTKSARMQGFFDGPCWIRTSDLGIKSPLLYQLS